MNLTTTRRNITEASASCKLSRTSTEMDEAVDSVTQIEKPST